MCKSVLVLLVALSLAGCASRPTVDGNWGALSQEVGKQVR